MCTGRVLGEQLPFSYLFYHARSERVLTVTIMLQEMGVETDSLIQVSVMPNCPKDVGCPRSHSEKDNHQIVPFQKGFGESRGSNGIFISSRLGQVK
jgi:hypothetical protein